MAAAYLAFKCLLEIKCEFASELVGLLFGDAREKFSRGLFGVCRFSKVDEHAVPAK